MGDEKGGGSPKPLSYFFFIYFHALKSESFLRLIQKIEEGEDLWIVGLPETHARCVHARGAEREAPTASGGSRTLMVAEVAAMNPGRLSAAVIGRRVSKTVLEGTEKLVVVVVWGGSNGGVSQGEGWELGLG
ncbi:hypothetical protein PIB30_053573 [Stylosanthes scabra]|uniref:Uncharacterized protein n=1 Tax=Stylosanthes scabra TaxID=79078 RepID=A0ABU6SIH9_9FABA|nr:hypothetical protein [Stylosanthes scabra]